MTPQEGRHHRVEISHARLHEIVLRVILAAALLAIAAMCGHAGASS